MPLLALAWTAFMFFMASVIWRGSRSYTRPELGSSTRDNYRETVIAKFFRKMSFTALILCVVSAVLVWSSFAWALVAFLAIPAVAALQIVRRKKSLESSGNQSLPLR